MPKINVYLPDELADAVKETGLPVSAVCQRALEVSVKRVSAIRAVVLGDLGGEDPTAALTSFTDRTKDVIQRAIARARERGVTEVGTRDLLLGMVSEGGNLALHVLRSIDIEPEAARREAERLAPSGESDGDLRMGATAANALELTVVEAIALGHNYVGCEHLLLGLLAEPDGAGGEVLRGLGVELRAARHAVGAMLAGYRHAQLAGAGPAQTLVSDTINQALQPVIRRLEQLEERVGA